jgi:hypothetical protein
VSKKRTMSHSNACKIHARRRMAERVGTSLSKVKLASMIKAIQHNRARPVGRSSSYRTHFLFKIGRRLYVAVYSKRMKTIITVWKVGPVEFNPELAVAV